MPLKLVTARNAKTANIYVRGSYLGVSVDQSCRTDRGSVARQVLKRIEGQIERGEYGKPAARREQQQLTFIAAAVAYLEAGRRRRYVAKLIKHFGETPLNEIDQSAIDRAAVALHPHAGPGTRNAAVYTPVSAILRHAGVVLKLTRPSGAKGRVVTDWLVPADAFGVIAAAEALDPEFALLLRILLYTGIRLGAALSIRREDVRIEERRMWVRHQKNQPSAEVRLREDESAALATHLAAHPDRWRVFRFHQGGHLKHMLTRAKLAHLGLSCPARRPRKWRPPPHRLVWMNFHSFRHTWATWMRQSGTDVKGLVATGNWKDERSASRYAHAVASEEWQRVDRLPSMGKIRGNG